MGSPVVKWAAEIPNTRQVACRWPGSGRRRASHYWRPGIVRSTVGPQAASHGPSYISLLYRSANGRDSSTYFMMLPTFHAAMSVMGAAWSSCVSLQFIFVSASVSFASSRGVAST